MKKPSGKKNGASESEARVNVVHTYSVDVVGFQIPSTTNEKPYGKKQRFSLQLEREKGKTVRAQAKHRVNVVCPPYLSKHGKANAFACSSLFAHHVFFFFSIQLGQC